MDGAENLWSVPNLLLQKFPAPSFTATTEVRCGLRELAGHGGLLVMGSEYAHLSVRRTADGGELVLGRNTAPSNGDPDTVVERMSLQRSSVRLRATVEDGGRVQAYATGDSSFEPIGAPFEAQQGRWIGAKIGLFTVQPAGSAVEGGYCDFNHFRVEE